MLSLERVGLGASAADPVQLGHIQGSVSAKSVLGCPTAEVYVKVCPFSATCSCYRVNERSLSHIWCDVSSIFRFCKERNNLIYLLNLQEATNVYGFVTETFHKVCPNWTIITKQHFYKTLQFLKGFWAWCATMWNYLGTGFAHPISMR